ncbi:hypothetical protein BOTBODRAFT_519365 [Botryobasidium botryosum FD-172 SS1]|uniref:F-box domain-containing protein n=1 Tax=Botryobasidium botryosum (strain FD-172 SS1) TaxID=930990 RepID=A0A067MSK2_BOTB1|nr:hypothetical protein BOTBODRAFT_519365 [Botryobasidium botryosum FD-172 SS1]
MNQDRSAQIASSTLPLQSTEYDLAISVSGGGEHLPQMPSFPSAPYFQHLSVARDFPPEIWGIILRCADRSTLLAAASTNRRAQREAERLLYRDVNLPSHNHALAFLQSLLTPNYRHRKYALHRLAIKHSFCYGCPLDSDDVIFLDAPNLIDVNVHQTRWSCAKAAWSTTLIISPNLRRLSTGLLPGVGLIEAMSRCPHIEEVVVRDDGGSPPLCLLDTMLLPLLRSAEGHLSVLEYFIPGRPVREVGIRDYVHLERLEAIFSLLAKSTAQLECLTLTLGWDALQVLSRVAKHFSSLRILNVILNATLDPRAWWDLSPARITDWSLTLCEFPCIEKFTLQGSAHNRSCSTTPKSWARHCPLLQTVIIRDRYKWCRTKDSWKLTVLDPMHITCW